MGTIASTMLLYSYTFPILVVKNFENICKKILENFFMDAFYSTSFFKYF